jgi:hypothetical protein
MENFWQYFWPELAATIIGASIGVFFGLFSDRKVREWSEQSKIEEEHQRLAIALDILIVKLEQNKIELEYIIKTLKDNGCIYISGIDCSAWEVTRADIMLYLHQPSLQQKITSLFSMMEKMMKLLDLHRDYSIGNLAILTSAEPMRETIKNYFFERLPGWIDETEKVKQGLLIIRGKLEPKMTYKEDG